MTSLIPRDFLFQLTQAEKAYVVANCDRIRNLTAPPKPGRRPIAINMSHMARFADSFPVAAMVSTLLAKSSHHMEQHLHQALIEAWELMARRVEGDE